MRRVARCRSFAAALLVVAVGCSTLEPAPDSKTAWGNATIAEELRIGVESGPDEFMFGRIFMLAVAPDGTIFVSDRQPLVVRQFAADGDFIRNIGRQGEGPGEYNTAPSIKVLPDGRLTMWDQSNHRVSFFLPGGEYETSFRADSATSGGVRGIQYDLDGNIYIYSFGEQGEVRTAPRVYLKYSTTGELLGRLELPNEFPDGQDFTLSSEGVRPFTVFNRWAWSPVDHLVVGRNDGYELEVRSPSHAKKIGRQIQATVLEDEELREWNEFRDYATEIVRQRGGDLAYNPIPTTKPFFRDFYVGEDGRIWVFRYVSAEKRDIAPDPERPGRPVLTWREPNVYDVFEPDGTFLGSVTLPERFRPLAYRGEQIWGTSTDEDGVERVVRLRVVPEVR